MALLNWFPKPWKQWRALPTQRNGNQLWDYQHINIKSLIASLPKHAHLARARENLIVTKQQIWFFSPFLSVLFCCSSRLGGMRGRIGLLRGRVKWRAKLVLLRVISFSNNFDFCYQRYGKGRNTWPNALFNVVWRYNIERIHFK